MSAKLRIACTSDGCVLSIEGRGTMKESLVAKELAQRTLRTTETSSVIFDLTSCEYLDSTFLGCLVDLRKQFPDRFCIAAPSAVRKKLLGPLRLDLIIPSIDTPPATQGQWVNVNVPSGDKSELLNHVMQSHRQLSECDTPMKAAFIRIADEMAAELRQ